MQDYYNLLYREEEREMLPFCRSQNIAVIPWSPMARGKLTRDWDASSARLETDEVAKRLYAVTEAADRQVVEQVAAVAAAVVAPSQPYHPNARQYHRNNQCVLGKLCYALMTCPAALISLQRPVAR
ncbi:hypothetical protein SE17_19385 [Kouleothrix aurantiaca]|uniref:NADP-dependent oxidoreductase domain-containing protein n=1 Tax=Kouleothrix aurantiaca TaxID=186479 RepID=A0A0P9F5I4_9CHLR|nr:hypothetical protein SE17_19385 [Kouleothrix aurantiaca]